MAVKAQKMRSSKNLRVAAYSPERKQKKRENQRIRTESRVTVVTLRQSIKEKKLNSQFYFFLRERERAKETKELSN